MFRKLTLKDLQLYYSCAEATAKRRHKELRNYFNKRCPTIYDLAIYEGYPPTVVDEYLNS